MKKQIKNIYVVHHSHTDIGYTDLQEKVLYNHIDYINSAIAIIKKGYKENSIDKKFRWNCETYFCVEKYLEQATDEQKNDFFDCVRKGNIGISGTYLNFTDLADKSILNKKAKAMVETLKSQGFVAKSAMNADINGISMGARDVLIDNGIEFLFTNIHCHHGMFPLYRNQTAYFWENEAGKKLLVFSGEHYNLGNALGIHFNKKPIGMTDMYFGKVDKPDDHLVTLKSNIDKLVAQYYENNYEYDFIVTSVSGVASDNAPPNPEILRTLEDFNKLYGDEIKMEMVNLDELYEKIYDDIKNSPVYKGDLNDWWANGIGSTPYAIKHFKEAQRAYHLCNRLDEGINASNPEFTRQAEENLLIYSEHTWGHSSTITNPYDTMVLNLDMRKTSYASKAHEATAKNLNRITHKLGDMLRYYGTSGKIKSINATHQATKKAVEFYVETPVMHNITVINEKTGELLSTQLSTHPRGVLVSFVDHFEAFEHKTYTYEEQPKTVIPYNTSIAHVGAERIKDIINDYDKLTYTLPYGVENDYFKISYEIGKGVTSFYNKVEKKEMLCEGSSYAKFFTPVYEKTEIRKGVFEERRIIGRNIRGLHAKQYQGELIDIKCLETGDVFTAIELIYKLEGTHYSSIVIKFYRDIPKIDFKYKLAKTLSEDIESVYLPLALDFGQKAMYINKGDTIMRPGIDQIPGTGMEYYIVDDGIVYEGKKSSILIHIKDTPLIYMGELKHHPIKLCDNKEEYNKRDTYSWIMNNTWETNFKIDLSGFAEFCYSLDLIETKDVKNSFEVLNDNNFGVVTFITD